ncbi:hypothetical protein CFC21_046572 [Triticum aestivum]|uniref:DUF674 domain-containing protein n=3 Tax=Triticinae TaxID=1648030 RepID=A0A3B6DNH7_WHEAT|nr:hypothetical protein CFC21_046572 [Triticum aestivum]
MGTKELFIKLMIDTNSQKVCFAEASREVVEFLAALLSLPLGTVINLQTKENMIGSISNLLDWQCREAGRQLQEQAAAPQPIRRHRHAQPPTAPAEPVLPQQRPQQRPLRRKRNSHGHISAQGHVHTVGDDLSVTPASFFTTISLLGLPQLAQCSIKDLNTLQEKTVKIGHKEALGILAASLKSKTVLTDVFLPKKN